MEPVAGDVRVAGRDCLRVGNLAGRQVWWLGFVFAGSVAAQSHLAAAPVMLVVGLVLVGAVVQRAITERDAADHAIVWFYAGIVLILLWIPPLADVILHSGGNSNRYFNSAAPVGTWGR